MKKTTVMQSEESSSFSRRSFLVGAGASAVALAGFGLAGCAPKETAAEEAKEGSTSGEDAPSKASSKTDTVQDAMATPAEKTESKEADIVVIGSGIAGMSAAVQAARQGAKVIVLEKHNATGGDSSICSGNFYCCGSKKQDELGLTNYGTPEEIAQFFFDQSDGDANMDICRLVAEHGGEAMDWLVSMGCDFEKKAGEGVSDRSMVSKTSGKGLVDNLIADSEKNGVELMMETRVVELVMDGDKIAGVKARQKKTEYDIKAKAVVIASGGYDGQSWSKELYAPGAAGWNSLSSPSNTGDGIELAKQAGAMILLKGGLSQIQLVGKEYVPLNDPISKLRMVNTGVYVSDLGYRCANESLTSQFDYFTPFIKSGRSSFFIICDSQQPSDRLDLLEQGVAKGVVNKADTLEALAVDAGLPAYPLTKTIEHYNTLAEKGEDTDFHKKPEDLQKLEKAPFYAVQITPNTNDSFGAIPISTKAEALDENRKPVAGLYAAGTIANPEMFYMRYSVSGSSLCMGTVTGRIAADEAIKYYSA